MDVLTSKKTIFVQSFNTVFQTDTATLFTESAPRQIHSIAMSMAQRCCVLCNPLIYFFNVILLSFKKDTLQKSDERKLVSEFAILAQKLSKIARGKKSDFWVFANHTAVHSVGVSRGRVRGCGCWH